jgi:hypothetical protein
MSLPPDFNDTLLKLSNAGVLSEGLDQIEHRLSLSAGGIAANEAQQDMGITDWADESISKIKITIHEEICDAQKKQLKDDYKELLDQVLTTDGITTVSSIIGGIVATVSPVFFASPIIIYLSIWLLKRGLNKWCAIDYH